MAVAPGVCCPPPAIRFPAPPESGPSGPDHWSPFPQTSLPGFPPPLSSDSPSSALSSPTPSDSTGADVPATTSATTGEVPAFGWSAYAERVNGRFAMLGFASVLVIEVLSHDTLLHWAGLVP